MGRFSVHTPVPPLWAIHPGLRPSQPGLRPSQPGLRPIQLGLRPRQLALQASRLRHGWLGVRPGWLGLKPGWMAQRGGRTDKRTNVQKISPFYKALSPIRAAALLPPMKTKKKVEQGKGTGDYLLYQQR